MYVGKGSIEADLLCHRARCVGQNLPNNNLILSFCVRTRRSMAHRVNIRAYNQIQNPNRIAGVIDNAQQEETPQDNTFIADAQSVCDTSESLLPQLAELFRWPFGDGIKAPKLPTFAESICCYWQS